MDYPEDIDKELIPLLDLLNNIVGVKTVYSCSGHGKEPFYLVADITDFKALEILTKIFERPKYRIEIFNTEEMKPNTIRIRIGTDHQFIFSVDSKLDEEGCCDARIKQTDIILNAMDLHDLIEKTKEETFIITKKQGLFIDNNKIKTYTNYHIDSYTKNQSKVFQ